MSFIFWLGIILLLDVSVGLFFYDKWKSLIRLPNFDKIIWIEALLALILLTIFFLNKII